MLRFNICIIGLLFSASTSADVAVNFQTIPNNSAPELAGFVTQDIQVLTTNDWTSSGMVLTLTSGSIYQAIGGGDQPLPAAVTLGLPALAFDTYVGIVDDQTGDIAGAAGDLGGAGGSPYTFDTQALDLTWFNISTAVNSTNTNYGLSTIGRLSLSSDAQGTLAFSVSEADRRLAVYEFPVIDGHVIPDQCYGLPGDVGCNAVGIEDLNNVLTNWNQSVEAGNPAQGDYNHDGFVGITDLNTILSFWNIESEQQTSALLYNPAGLLDDGFVGISDLNVILGSWNMSVPPSDPLADPTEDGYVGQDDLNVILSLWNAGTPPTQPVPEPGLGSLLLMGLAVSGLRCRRLT